MRKLYPFILGVPLLVTFPGRAFCDTGQPSVMDEVVVSASRFEEKAKEVSSNVGIIGRAEIERSPSTNLAELLAEKGIGHIQKYPGSLGAIGIRGFRTDTHGNDLQGHVLILLDGRRAGTGNAVKILNKNIERVEVIRGPGAVQYGSAGMGGVVNVITRQGEENGVFVEGGAGSYGRMESSIGGTVKEGGLDFSGTISTRTLDDYDTGGGDTFHNTGIDRETGVSVNAGYSFDEDQRIGLIFTGYDVEKSGSPGYLSQNDRDDYNDKSNYSLDTRYDGSAGRYRWMARYFFGRDENIWNDPVSSNPDYWDDGVSSTNTTDQQGAQLQATGDFGFFALTGGFDWIHYDVENSWSPQETTYSNPAMFLLGKARMMDERLITTFGLRYDWFKVEVEEPAGRDEDQDHLTPQIGLAWLPMDALKLRARYAQGFMMPSADQLAIDTVSWGSRVVGNPDLDPESSETYEAGFDYSKSGLKSSLTWFHTDFEDKIVSEYRLDGSRSWENVGDAVIEGIEAELSYDLGAPWQLAWEIRPYVSLTHLLECEDETTGDDLLYVSDASLSAGIEVSDFQGMSARLNITHYSSQRVKDHESGIYPSPVVELDAITVADLTGSYRFYQSEQLGAFTVRVEVLNIFDEDYVYVKGYPMPGRRFFLGLRWDYQGWQ